MTAPETIFVTADVDELADTIDLYAQITPEGMTGKPERYTRTDLTIRRDDPVLKQVMEALEGSIETAAMVARDLRRKAQHPQCEMNASSLEANNREARAAIVTLRERMGGMDA